MTNAGDRHFTVRRITLLALMTAAITVGRVVFALPALPNIQPMTALLIIIVLNLDAVDGLVIAFISLIVTNMVLGMGPWTLLQMISYAVIVLLTAVLKLLYRPDSLVNRVLFSIWGLLVGFIFGAVISYLSYFLYGMSNLWVYWLNGLPFDFLHGASTVVFYFILEPIFQPLIRKYYHNL